MENEEIEMLSILRKRVAFHETDCMGVVHHAVYAKYFEEARVEYLYQKGLEAHHFPQIDFILAVLSLEVSYLKPLRVCDEFEVKIKPSKEGSAKFLFEYEIFKGDELVTTGKTLHVGLNSSLKVVKPPIELVAGLS